MSFINQIEPYITESEIKALTEYLRSGGWLTEFKKTEEFEKMLAEFLGMKYVVVVTSGTAALYLSILGTGIGKRDKVVVPNYTMIASINAVKWAGAEPIIVDVEPSTLCVDLKKIPLNSGCKALMYVSINGRSGAMSEIVDFCRKHKLILLEDACQSLGSKWQDKYLGTFGDVGSFSFTPHKIITTGQGGAIVTDNENIYNKVKKLKDFHRTKPATDWHDGLGFNFKFTDIQSVIGIEQIKLIDARIKRKKEIFEIYSEKLTGIEGIQLLPMNLRESTPWFIDVILPSREVRDSLIGYLRNNSIGSRPFYPPLNHQKIYSGFKKGTFPVSEDVAHRGLWLPSSMGLKGEEIEFISKKIRIFFEGE